MTTVGPSPSTSSATSTSAKSASESTTGVQLGHGGRGETGSPVGEMV